MFLPLFEIGKGSISDESTWHRYWHRSFYFSNLSSSAQFDAPLGSAQKFPIFMLPVLSLCLLLDVNWNFKRAHTYKSQGQLLMPLPIPLLLPKNDVIDRSACLHFRNAACEFFIFPDVDFWSQLGCLFFDAVKNEWRSFPRGFLLCLWLRVVVRAWSRYSAALFLTEIVLRNFALYLMLLLHRCKHFEERVMNETSLPVGALGKTLKVLSSIDFGIALGVIF